MIIKTKVTEEKDVEINLDTPTFYKDVAGTIKDYLAVMEECTIRIWDQPGSKTMIENKSTEDSASIIADAYNKWEHISEEEFMEALDKALKDFDFKPKLITLPILTHEEQEQRDRDREEERVNDYWERELDRD